MLHLYDTRARAVVPIHPGQPGRLTVYACGPTVYRDAHVGNLRTFMLADLIARVAAARGLDVTVVQNITDVGHMLDDTGFGADELQPETSAAGQDRMLQAVEREGGAALAIARRYEAAFKRDCDELGITPATHYPRASECIDSMVAIIERLLESGHAYVGGDGSVFFDARSFAGYGAISGNQLDALRPGHRFDGESDPNKRFHADWALWKAAPATRTQLVWETALGRGFPGWHIECTAML
ncbi:MAG: cysteine--tRNA ligase, partial [Actinobacteria bacterium]|nr:cysteine--tRNA ligase [Actinomycetota bacterium]